MQAISLTLTCIFSSLFFFTCMCREHSTKPCWSGGMATISTRGRTMITIHLFPCIYCPNIHRRLAIVHCSPTRPRKTTQTLILPFTSALCSLPCRRPSLTEKLGVPTGRERARQGKQEKEKRRRPRHKYWPYCARPRCMDSVPR